MTGTLYLVATPIGNLQDITFRALETLKTVDLIACEDTRHTQKLLNHYGIKTRTISYHDHNEKERARELLERLKAGLHIAVVSDAGTPAISDPGFRLTQAALAEEIRVVPVPGPAAVTAALVASGLPTDEFFFGGFLPARTGARRARLGQLNSLKATLVFYEAPHRISAMLQDARDVLGEREAAVARELTKLHEEVVRGSLSDLAKQFSVSEQARGEMVVIIDRQKIETAEETESVDVEIADLVAQFESAGLNQRAALKQAARQLGISRDEAYRRLVAARHS